MRIPWGVPTYESNDSKLLLQGKQFLFLTAQEDLTAEHAQERKAIGEALPDLEAAWTLKEALLTWYATSTEATAAQGLDSWALRVQHL